MKTRWIAAFFLLSVLLLSVTAMAHSGRTDAKGGHTNHSTGEYHYHHGQPEHDHYDMDNDGVVDCPYTFTKNATNSLDNSTPDETEDYETSPTDDFSPSEDITFGRVVRAMLKSLLPAIAVGLLIVFVLSHLFVFIFGDDKGTSLALISFAIISVVAFIWFIFADLF